MAEMAGGTLELLEDLVRVLDAGDFSELGDRVVRIARRNSGLERIRFYLAHPRSGQLKLEAIAGEPMDGASQEVELSSSTLLGRVALQECGPVMASFPPPAAVGGRANRIPACIVPFRLPSAHIGVIVGENPSGRSICDYEARVLQALANFSAAGMGRSVTGDLGIGAVSVVSHELRTPLTSIVAFTEMLLDGDGGPLTPQQERYMRRIQEGTAVLFKIVEDLLQLTRLIQGNAPIEPSVVEMRGFIRDAVINFEPQAQTKGISLRVKLPPELPRLITDRERLRQALGNLIDNAIKYSPAGSRVTVQASADNGQLCIAVTDQGPGIAPDVQSKVFEAFYRCHREDVVQQQKGSGLGLTVVQCIVRLLGAEVGLQSDPGKGSTFSLLFPLRDAIQDERPGNVGAFYEQRTE